MLKIDLLVSTMNYKSGALDLLLDTVPDDVNVIVINQITNDHKALESFPIKKNVICYSYVEKGLSKSRNKALSLAAGNIFVITDDDIQFLPNAFEKIRDAFIKNPDQGILTFQMIKPDGKGRKNYKKLPFQHNKRSVASVSSCEIAGNREVLLKSKVKYDTDFGLGAKYALAEEVIFLQDCIKLGLKIRYIPIAIASHPDESTGRIFSEQTEFARGAAFYRLFGLLSYPLGVLFYLKKRKFLSMGLLNTMNIYYRGINDYRNSTKMAPTD